MVTLPAGVTLVDNGRTERVILGLMTYGPDENAGSRILTLEEFESHLDYFQGRGYDEVDTARMYVNGQQEAWSRRAGWEKRGLTLATKLWPETEGIHAPTELRKHFDISLRELGTNCIDIWYLHAPDRSVEYVDTLCEVDKLYREGKFKRLGLSNYAAWEIAEIYNIAKERNWVMPTIYQGMYNVFTRNTETELIPCIRKYNMDLVIYNPLCGGLFSGKIKAADLVSPPTEGRFSDSYQWGRLYCDRFLNEANISALEILESVTKKHNLTMLETALRWIVHHSALNTRAKGGNDGVILGVSNFQQLERNIADIEKGKLP